MNIIRIARESQELPVFCEQLFRRHRWRPDRQASPDQVVRLRFEVISPIRELALKELVQFGDNLLQDQDAEGVLSGMVQDYRADVSLGR